MITDCMISDHEAKVYKKWAFPGPVEVVVPLCDIEVDNVPKQGLGPGDGQWFPDVGATSAPDTSAVAPLD